MRTANSLSTSRLYVDGIWTATYNSFKDYVQPSAIIKGNHTKPNAWSYAVERINYPSGGFTTTSGHYGGNPWPPASYQVGTGPLQSLQIAPGPDTYDRRTDCYNLALSRLNEKVRGGLDLSVALGEAHTTYRMLRSMATFKRYFSGVGPKRWANEYLQLKYGWKPLLSDIYNAAEELIRVNLGLMYFKSRASIGGEPTGYASSGGPIDASGVGHYTKSSVSVKFAVTYSNFCELKVLLKAPTSVQQAARWSSLNPLSIAWELTPYSFVVDWFVDVGSYLRDLESSILYNSAFLSGYKTLGQVYYMNSKCSYGASRDYFTYITSLNMTAGHKRILFNRTLLADYPSPSRPVVKVDLQSSQLLSAAALLTQLLGRK